MKYSQTNQPNIKTARIYMRVSTDEQETERQERLVSEAQASGYYIAGIYREKASGAIVERPELKRMIDQLQPGDTVIAERIDRISRLPLPEAEALIATIKSKGVRLAIPGIVEFEDLAKNADKMTQIILEAVQDLLLKIALQMSRDDYETRRKRQKEGIELAKKQGKYRGRTKDLKKHQEIIDYRKTHSIAETAQYLKCSESLVKKVCREHKKRSLLGMAN